MISVVIPTHNRSELLKRAVLSVSKQTLGDIEIIVVSDGSTDNTENVIKELIASDSRIIFEAYPEAKGANFARNKGIELSKGEYIAFLDDDDEWDKQKLEKQLNVFKAEKDVGLVYTGSNIMYINEKITYSNIPKDRGDLSKSILLYNQIGTTSTVVLKTSIVKKVGGFDTSLKALQDYDLWIRICQLTKVGVVSEPCINYYNFTGQKQISQNTEKYEEAINEIEAKYSELFDNLTEDEKNIKASNAYTLLATKSMRNKNKRKAVVYSTKAFLKKPSLKKIIYIGLSLFNYKLILKFRKLLIS